MSSGFADGLLNLFGKRPAATPSPEHMSPDGSPRGPVSYGLGGAPISPTVVDPDMKKVTPKIIEVSNAILNQVVIPTEFVCGISIELQKVLTSVEEGKFPELVEKARTPCVSDYLKSVFVNLYSQIASLKQAIPQHKVGPELNDFLAGIERQKLAYFIGIAELLGRGYDVTLKPNLTFDAAGNPTGVRETDRTRFPNCHEYLTSRMKPGGKRKKTKKNKSKKRKTLRRRKLHR